MTTVLGLLSLSSCLFFEKTTCILHHLAFLVGAQIVFLSMPKYALLVPKTPLFDGHFALFGHVFHGS